MFAHAADVLHHGKAQCVGVDAAEPVAVVGWLIDDAGVRLQELHHEAVGHLAFVIQVVEQCVMPEGGPALVHHLGLALGVEVLGDLAHDAYYLPLPGLQQRGVLFDEVQQVLLGLGGIAGFLLPPFVVLVAHRYGAPQVVDLALQVFLAFLLTATFLLGGDRRRAFVAVHAVVHQRMAGVEQILHRIDAMALFALGDVLPGEYQIVDDGAGIGPAAEQVVALEEGVVAVAGVGDDQRLHAHGVLFHQIGDAGVGVDDDLVGQTHLPALVVLLRVQEVLAVGPMVVTQRHAYRGVGIHHLLGGDHLDLVGVGVQAVDLMGDTADLPVIFADQLEGPLRPAGNGLAAHVTILFWNSLRNTG